MQTLFQPLTYGAENAQKALRTLILVLLPLCSTFAQAPCSVPVGVKVSSILSSKLTLTWDASNLTGGAKIQVAWAPYPTSNFIFKSFASGTSGSVEGLKPATKYIIRVSKICGPGSVSDALGMGTVRTLSKAEELALCGPEQSGDLCEALHLIETGERAATTIDILFPALPAAALASFPGHTVTISYRPLDAAGLPVGGWQSVSHPYSEIPGHLKLEGLTANTLYQLTVKWDMLNAAGAIVNTCLVDLNNTPTMGPVYSGPVFSQKMATTVTLDCSTPEPIELPFPNVSGGCTRPHISFTDQELAQQNCARHILRTWLAVDDCGRTAIYTQTIVLVDTKVPIFVDVPANDVTIACGENLPTEEPTAVDNCSAVTLTSTQQITVISGCKSTITRTWTAKDGCGNTATYVQTINVLEAVANPDDEDDEVPPLPVNCSQTYTQTTITNNNPLPTAIPGQIFTIYGFPSKLKTVSGSNGIFSGLTKVRLPFGNKVVYCNFTGAHVNTDRKITQGTLIAVSDPNFVFPDTGTVNFGGEICLPNPPSLTNGFNSQGEYVLQPPYDDWEPGDPIDPNYDPNGFDVNGFSRETGTQYNEAGCSQEGLDSLGVICNPGAQGPYYWLHTNDNSSGPTTPEGLAYAAELQQSNPNIRDLVLAAINLLIPINQTALTNQRVSCDGIRTNLNTQLGSLDRVYFFGENDIFFAEGMSQNFTSKPVALQQTVPNRNPQIIAVETKHIELYYCDKQVSKYKETDLILNAMKSLNGLDLLVPKVLEAIKRLTKEQVDQFHADPNALKAWIRTFIEGQVDEKLQEKGIVMTSPEEQANPAYLSPKPKEEGPAFSPANQFPRTGTMLASADDEATMRILAAQSLGMSPKELQFEYYQGFEYVGGVDRAFYLDAIAKARDLKYSPPGDDDGESLLPIRIEKEVGGRTYTILLDQIQFTPTGGTMNAYFILDVPNSGQKIVFRAQNIPFSPSGLTNANAAKLRLQSNVGIRLNNAAKLIIIGANNNTFIAWDCNGFKQMGIEADVEFCREFLLPLKPNLDVDPDETKRVKAHFTATMPAWGEFIATLNMGKFALTKHPDYKWEVVNASLDFSETENLPNFSGITPNYLSEFGSGSSFSPQWKGFFMERLSVTLPKNLNKNSSTPITVIAEKLIIDDRGLTGLISVNVPVISLDNGNLDGWAYSIDQLSIAVVANKIQGGGFAGKLHIPLFKATTNNTDNITAADCFDYKAKIIATDVGDLYEFTVTPSTTPKKMDILVGTAVLEPESSLKVTYANDSFNIITNLTGSITIDGKLDSSGHTRLLLPTARFQDVRISNHAPYFRGGTMQISGTVGAKIGNFGLQVTLPKLVNGGPAEAVFSVGAAITLVGDTPKDGGSGLNFGAATKVKVIGELKTVNGRQIWKYKDYAVEQIKIDASFKGVKSIKGTIDWFKDNPVFGTGFRGQVSIQLEGLGKKNSGTLGIDALAQFGRKDDYKYFFVDALARFGAGQVNISGLDIRGIGGGIYYHMARDTNAFKGMDQAPDAFILPNGLGVSLSGILYTPSDAISLGIKFSVIVATPTEKVFNAGVTLEVRFNAPNPPATSGIGGIKDIALYGSAQMMAEIKFGPYNGQPSPAAPISANLAITYDFATKTLHGELGVFANVEGAFTGAGPNNSVGKAVIHFDPDKWYINLGTPSQPLGIKMKIPVGKSGSGEGIDLFVVKSYLCVGTGIPPMPPLPAYVSQMTGATNFLANESRRATGKGFAMGASVALSTGDLEFLIFYGHLDAGLGFDVLLQKYDGVICANNNNKPLGINGWYAAGQAWAYLDAEVGVKWKNKHFAILKLGAAAALQLKLPNPFWARGAVGGNYKILGGLIKGHCNFKFTLGKSCDSEVEDDVSSAKLIEELNPADQGENVEVTTKPTAYFSVPVASSFSLYNSNGDEILYDAVLSNLKLTKASTGAQVATDYKLSDDKYSATPTLSSFLPGNTEYVFTATVRCLLHSTGALIKEETKTVHFTTASAPNVIPPSNVRTSYPQNGMYNFYKNEWAKGYIELIDGQPYLFEDGAFVMRFSTKQNGVVASVPIAVEYGANKITFDIPSTLANTKTYRMELVRLGVGEASAGGSGGASRPGSGDVAEDPDPTGDLEQLPKDLTLFTAYFRTSQYNRFVDKITAFRQNAVQSSTGDLMMYLTLSNFEPFDRLETRGTGQVPALMRPTVGSSAFKDSVYLWYGEMKDLDFVPRNRTVTAGSSLVPSDLLTVPADTALIITSDMYENGFQSVPGVSSRLEYRLFQIFNFDLGYFKNDVKTAISMECGECCATGACGLTFPPNNNGAPACQGANCYNPLYTCCCCSSTNSLLNTKKIKSQVYSYMAPRPVQGSQHPVNIAYRLPNGTVTIAGFEIQFKY